MRPNRCATRLMALIGLVGLGFAISCGGTPHSSGQGGPGSTSPEVLYAATSSGIAAFTVNTTTGSLTGVTGSPFAAGAQPSSLGLDPGGKFLYSVSAVVGSSNLMTFSINTTTGALTLANSATFPSIPGFVVVDPSGRNAYVLTSTGSGQRLIGGYAIDATTHALTLLPGFPIATAVTPQALAMDPAGRFVYALGLGEVDVFARDSVTGNIAAVAGSPFAFTTAGAHTFGMTTVPAGNFLLATLFDANAVAVLSVSAGGLLSPASGSPFAAGTGAFAVAIEPNGRFVYVANQGTPPANGTVSAFTLGSNGTLTLVGAPVNAGVQPNAIAADPTGKFVFVANSGSNTISAYSINTTTGALTALSGTPPTIPTGVQAVAVRPAQ